MTSREKCIEAMESGVYKEEKIGYLVIWAQEVDSVDALPHSVDFFTLEGMPLEEQPC